jgi:hypothetical protein
MQQSDASMVLRGNLEHDLKGRSIGCRKVDRSQHMAKAREHAISPMFQ